jgi:nitrogen fixation protein FixH
MSSQTSHKPFTGKHMTMILVAFFGVVIAVNFTMAFFASSTFGGLVVENSYVASQEFNGWLKQARAEKALGWTLDVKRGPRDRLDLSLSSEGTPLDAARIDMLVRHPLGRLPERTLTFRELGGGRYESTQALPAGRWILHVEAKARGRAIHKIVDLQ